MSFTTGINTKMSHKKSALILELQVIIGVLFFFYKKYFNQFKLKSVWKLMKIAYVFINTDLECNICRQNRLMFKKKQILLYFLFVTVFMIEAKLC